MLHSSCVTCDNTHMQVCVAKKINLWASTWPISEAKSRWCVKRSDFRCADFADPIPCPPNSKTKTYVSLASLMGQPSPFCNLEIMESCPCFSVFLSDVFCLFEGYEAVSWSFIDAPQSARLRWSAGIGVCTSRSTNSS